jgi:hypothetical protein
MSRLTDEPTQALSRHQRTASTRRRVCSDEVLIRHELQVPVEHERAGALLDSLGSTVDRLWPSESWPAHWLDRRIGVGARGGNGPVRYVVDWYQPGRRVRYRFLRPRGVRGWHEYTVDPTEHGTQITHSYAASHRGAMRLIWPVALRPLHDAATLDSLAKAQRELGLPAPPVRRGRWVRLLRLTLPLSALLWPERSVPHRDG